MKWAWGLVPLIAIIGLSLAILCTKRPSTARADVEDGPKTVSSVPTPAARTSAAPAPTSPRHAIPPRLGDAPVLETSRSMTPLTRSATSKEWLPPSLTPNKSAPSNLTPPTTATPGLALDGLPTFTNPANANPAPPRHEPLGGSWTGGLIPPQASNSNTLDAGALPSPTRHAAGAGVELEWVGSTALQVGQAKDYSLMVRNRSAGLVHDAVVRLQMPAGIAVKGTTPPATSEQGSWLWHLETLLPGQVLHLHVNLLVSKTGASAPEASLTFTSSVAAILPLSAYQPKLALHVSRPTRVVLGDTAAFTIHVQNMGDGPAENVQVHATLSPGLDHPRGKQVDFDLGNLGTGEARDIQLICTANGDGQQRCQATAVARAGVQASDQASIAVLAPRLDLQVKGPTVRYVERRAAYSMTVTNQGNFPAYNVSASEALPSGFRFLSATAGGHFEPSTRVVSWFLGELGPGQTRDIQFEVVAVHAGSYEHRMRACSERGGRLEVERRLATRIEDISALRLEVSNSDNPVELGKETVYEVVVSNAGSKTETNLRVVCRLPEQLAFRGARGPGPYHAEGNTIVFEPVSQLAPRGELVYKVTTRALAPGQVHFQARLTGTGLTEPIIRMERTRIYADRP